MDEPIYVSAAELLTAYDDLVSHNLTEDQLEGIITRAEAIVHDFTNCRDVPEVHDCGCVMDYRQCGCTKVKLKKYSRWGMCSCTEFMGEHDISTGLPKNTERYQMWLVKGNAVLDGITFIDGNYIVSESRRSLPKAKHFLVTNTKLKEVCLVPNQVRQAVLLAASYTMKIDIDDGSDDFCDSGSFSFGSFRISAPASSSSSKSNDCRDDFYCTPEGVQFMTLLNGFRCFGRKL